MKELTCCPGGDCPLKEKCLRHYEPGLGDTYLAIAPYDHENKTCESYVDSTTIMKRKWGKVIDGTPYFNKR